MIRKSFLAILKEEYDRMIRTGDVDAQVYREYVMRGSTKSPVEVYAQRKENLERLFEIHMKLIRPVDKLIEDLEHGHVRGKELDSRMLEILQRHYMRRESISSVSRSMNISRRKVYENIKRILRELRIKIKAEAKRIDGMRESGMLKKKDTTTL